MRTALKLLATTSLAFGLFSHLSAQDTISYDIQAIVPMIYWDYGKTASIWTSFETKHEVGGGLLLFDRVEVMGEYGLANLTPQNAFGNIDYTVEGTYWRTGASYMANIDPRNRIGLGFKYAEGRFSDTGEIRVITATDFNDDYIRNFRRDDLKASWGEINLVTQRKVLVSKARQPTDRINNLFSIGAVFRYRWMLSKTKLEEIPDYYSIPGFGRANTDGLLAVNLFLKVYIR